MFLYPEIKKKVTLLLSTFNTEDTFEAGKETYLKVEVFNINKEVEENKDF